MKVRRHGEVGKKAGDNHFLLFSHDVFYPIRVQICDLSHIYVVSKCSEFLQVKNFVIFLRVNPLPHDPDF